MILTLGTGEEIANPTADQISAALASLNGEGDSFAILGRTDQEYVQTTGGQTSGFLIEYQLGSMDQHFRSTRNDLPFSLVDSVFRAYSVGDSSWKSMAAWEHEDFGGVEKTRSGSLYVALGAALLLIAYLFSRSGA